MKQRLLPGSVLFSVKLVVMIALISFITFGCGGGGGGDDVDDVDDTPEAEATIGIDGGTVEVSDPFSPLYGVRIEFKENVLSASTKVKILKPSSSPNLPSDASSNGSTISIECYPSNTVIGYAILYIPVTDNDPESNEYLDLLYSNSETGQWERIQSWFDYENGQMVALTDHFSLFEPIKREIPGIGTEYFTQFQMSTDTLRYQNDVYNHCPQDSDGVCSGMSYFTEWFFENNGHGLRCFYSDVKAEKVSCETYNNYTNSIWSIIPGLAWIPQIADNHSTKLWLINAIKNGTPKSLSMIKLNPPKGHVILAYGWTPTDNEGNGYFTCYNVNDNTTPIKVYAQKITVPSLNYKPVRMWVENNTDWVIFGVWNKWGIEIEDVYNNNPSDYPCGADTEEGLVAHYPFNGDPYDASGNGYDGEEVGGVLYQQGVFGKALYCNGSDSYVKVPLNSQLTQSGTDEISISAWINVIKPHHGIISARPYFIFHWDAPDQERLPTRMQFNMGQEDGSCLFTVGSTNITAGWHNWIATYNGSEVKLYLDGNLESLLSASGNIGECNLHVGQGDGFLKFGYDYDDRFNEALFDEVRIYNYALSEDEIQSLSTN